MKKGQITIFIILGILILAIFAGSYFSLSFYKKEQLKQDASLQIELSQKSQSVYNLVVNCLSKSSAQALVQLGYYGGRDKLIETSFNSPVLEANYLFYEDNAMVPALPEMESSLNSMTEAGMKSCFESFESQDEMIVNKDLVNYDYIFETSVQKGEIVASTNIKDDEVIFQVQWPLKIRLQNLEKEITDYPPQKYHLQLSKMNLFLHNLTNKIKSQPTEMDAVYLLKQNYSIDVALYNNDTYLFLVVDNSSLIDYRPLTFLFAEKINPPKEITKNEPKN